MIQRGGISEWRLKSTSYTLYYFAAAGVGERRKALLSMASGAMINQRGFDNFGLNRLLRECNVDDSSKNYLVNQEAYRWSGRQCVVYSAINVMFRGKD